MRSNRTSYVRVELQSQEEAVTLCEESTGVGKSNEQLTERHVEDHAVGANLTVRKNCNILPWCLVVLLAAISVIFIIAYLSERNQKHKEGSPNAQKSRFNSYLNADDGIELRIQSDESSCVGPSCITCKVQIIPNVASLQCPKSEANVINGSCFLCGKACITIEDLLKKIKQNNKYLKCQAGQPPIVLTCCLLSVIGNLANYCGEGGQYSCYKHELLTHYNQSVQEPICVCPPGTKHCHKPYTELAQCLCYKSKLKFCGQEHITECSEVREVWSTCHMTRPKLDDQYNCLCNKSTGHDDHNGWCPNSDIDPNTIFNGSQQWDG